MNIKELLESMNDTKAELKISQDYYLWIEGLSNGCETSDLEQVNELLVEVHQMDRNGYADYVDTLAYGTITLETIVEDINLEMVQSGCGYIL